MDIEQLAGTRLGNYEIESLLGRGGMGVVYKARQISLNRPVALKILPPTLSSDASFVKRFKREAEAIAQLDHPNIVQIFDTAKAKGLHFFSMQYVEGRTLDEVLKVEGCLDADEAVRIVTQSAEGIEHAHRNGIIHRDIKPSNIIVDDSGNPKVMDFGLAYSMEERSRLTQSGTLMGTLDYMSPEQCRGEELDGRTDIYSLGVVLYEALSGKTPFEAPNEAALIHKIINEDPSDVQTLKPDIPIRLSKIIFKATAKDKEVRYSEIGEMLEDLRSCIVTSEPARATTPLGIDMPPPANRGRRTTVLAVGAILACLCVGAILLFRQTKEPAPTTITVAEGKTYSSIAVLPFVNMSADPDQEHLCDGMAEELINALAQLEDLRVIARTSAFSFKGQNIDIREIAERLDVEAILEGSVRKSGNRLRITAQLVDAATNDHLWSERYDKETKDIFAIQDEITLAIVDNLKIEIFGDKGHAIAERQAIDPEAYDLYLRARHLCWEISTEESLRKSIEYFEQVIEKAPDYALAYSGLANAYHFLQATGAISTMEASPKTRAATLKALELDDTIAHAYATLAWDKMIHDYDWDGAEKDFERAIKINPNYAIGHQFYAYYLSWTGQSERAAQEARKALMLDPLSPMINWSMGYVLIDSRQYDEAIKILQKAIELYPHYPFTRYGLGRAFELSGKYEEALQEYRKFSEIIEPQDIAAVGMIYAKMGKIDDAQRILESWLDPPEEIKYVNPSQIAFLYFALGDRSNGFQWLERAYDERDFAIMNLKVDPRFDGISSDPRYHALLRKMNLEPLSPAATESKAPEKKTYSSIAVLPFADMSPGKDQEYLCDGISEELINSLTKLGNLQVAARTSAFSFKGKGIKIQDIGQELNVETVLEGSVRKAGDRLRITAQLVDVANGYHLWSERYDRKMEGIFDIQDDITQAIVDKLKVKLLGGEAAKHEKHQPIDLEAYDLYLKGRYNFWNRNTKEGLEKAIEYFEQAIEKAPNYAPAYVGLADCYAYLPIVAPVRTTDTYPKAREIVLKALELDYTLSDAHVTMGNIKTYFDWDWKGAGEEYRRGIELNPSNPRAHHWYALYFLCLGRIDEAIEEMERALELDPLSPWINRNMGTLYRIADHPDKAMEAVKRTIEMDPHYPGVHEQLGWLYLAKSMYEEALAEFEKESEIVGSPGTEYLFGSFYAETGRTEEARQALESILERSKTQYVREYLISELYFDLGDTDKGFQWLSKAADERNIFLCFIKSIGTFDDVRSDPRYTAILKRINLDK